MAKMTAKNALEVVQTHLERQQEENETQQKERAIKYIKLAKRALGREQVELDPENNSRPDFTDLK